MRELATRDAGVRALYGQTDKYMKDSVAGRLTDVRSPYPPEMDGGYTCGPTTTWRAQARAGRAPRRRGRQACRSRRGRGGALERAGSVRAAARPPPSRWCGELDRRCGGRHARLQRLHAGARRAGRARAWGQVGLLHGRA